MKDVKICNAIISCYDKSGLKEFVAELLKINPELKVYSSSGTCAKLKGIAKDNVAEISEYVGFAEMPSGLVKTLHPKIHSGILADTENKEHAKYLEENGIKTFDLVVVNLYPFEKVVKEGKDAEEIRQNIDVGGVSLLEAASKNFLRVATVCDPDDYTWLAETLKRNAGSLDLKTRLDLAKKTMSRLCNYFAGIDGHYQKLKADEL